MISSKKKVKRRLVIRCFQETLVRFRQYAASYEDYEEALNSLLDLAEGRKKPKFL